jgi:hypothetical protein
MRALIRRVRAKERISDSEALWMTKMGYKLPPSFHISTRKKFIEDIRNHKDGGGRSIGVISSLNGETPDRFVGAPFESDDDYGSPWCGRIEATNPDDFDPFDD